MRSLLIKISLLLIAIVFTLNPASAQVKFSLVKANLEVAGTSTMHNWEMKSSKASASAVFVMSANNRISDINNLQLTTKLIDLKSESSGLDKNAYIAMKATDNPFMTYSANDLTVSTSDGINYSIKVNGKLTMAGATKPLDFTATGKMNADKSFTVSGTKALDMTAWGIKPPSFMMGAMKTGKDVTLKFNATFK